MKEPNVLYGPPLQTIFPNRKANESLSTLMYNRLREHGTKVSQIDAVTGRNQTFEDILNSSCILASSLKSRGLIAGDVLSICSENRLEFTIPLVAALYIGVVFAPLNPAYTTDEIIHALTISKPKIIFCSARVLSSICEAVRKCTFVSEIILFDQNEESLPCKVTFYSKLLESAPQAADSAVFEAMQFDYRKQTAVVLCSSGTTGLPKGVMLSHANLEAFVVAGGNPRQLSLTSDDRILGLLPFFHGYGYGMILNCILLGPTCVILPKFEENLFLSTIEKYKVSVLPTVPPLMVFLAKHPLVDKYDMSSVRSVFVGAAPCSVETINAVKKRLKLKNIRQGYGMTELSIAITAAPKDSNNPLTVGKLLAGAEGKVVDLETGESVGANVIGELCFRGPHIMQGYYDNPTATANIIDKQGWLHTGDVGYYDQEENFYIVDRLKELIKYKGFQVAPAELEGVILTHPQVKDAAVIGIADESSGELPKAYVVKQPGADIMERDIVDYVKGKVSSQKRLRGGVEFVSVIPRNPSGKVLRRILRDGIKSKL
ncbi:4-coumarate--CoA ligase 1 [Nilaparvata lugens]|uniref:4-coumarate--CoA ligase 1 n=1 Tax=Nilaparvata lugens TaxID=108931 RepID=UPI00193E5D74|nr:4-coumarate--CoA ligase 1 [Nilaparvata lugens]